MKKLIVYSNLEEIYITTLELESSFIEKATKKWKYSFDKDDGSFERSEFDLNNDFCVRVLHSTHFIID